MNGEDLKFLASRASTLEDRTAVRVEELHDRIAVARRRRTASALVGAACVVVALIVAIQVVTGARNNASPDPLPTPSPAPNLSTVQPVPGTCWNVPARLLSTKKTLWFDDSTRVPCTEPHTTETAQVVELSAATIAEARREGNDLCRTYVIDYLGVDDQSWIPWGFEYFLPSQDEVSEGASWVRCDALFLETWAYDAGVRTVAMSAEGIADDPPAELWACLDQPVSEDQPFVPCDQPHALEATGTLGTLEGEYPSPAELEAATQQQCREGVPEGYAGVEVTAGWDPPAIMEQYGAIAGVCFMYHADGTPMPPR